MLEYLNFTDGGFFGGYTTIYIVVKDGQVCASVSNSVNPDVKGEYQLSVEDSQKWLSDLEHMGIHKWCSEYKPFIPICDGEQWSIDYKVLGKRCRHITGDNAYPNGWRSLLVLMSRFTFFPELDEPEPMQVDTALLFSPVPIVNKYLVLCFIEDTLWSAFSEIMAPVYHKRNATYVPRTLEFLYQLKDMLTSNMGGGIPISIWREIAYCILRYQYAGNDINAALDSVSHLFRHDVSS